MEHYNLVPRQTPITDDGKVDVTEHNFPSAAEIAAARRAVEQNRGAPTRMG